MHAVDRIPKFENLELKAATRSKAVATDLFSMRLLYGENDPKPASQRHRFHDGGQPSENEPGPSRLLPSPGWNAASVMLPAKGSHR